MYRCFMQIGWMQTSELRLFKIYGLVIIELLYKFLDKYRNSMTKRWVQECVLLEGRNCGCSSIQEGTALLIETKEWG